MSSQVNKIQRKKTVDLISRSIIFLFAVSCIAILLLLFVMILKEAFPAYKHYGFFHMYFSADFSERGGWGIWGALAVTLITAIVAVLIALPIALRASFFIKYRLKRGQKAIKTLVNILAGVPSVVFGIFALNSLTSFTAIFGVHSAATVFVSIISLIIMIFPTLVSLISNQLELVPAELINASLALGNTGTHSMYKVVKKAIRQGVYVAAIMALGRAIGETMALSMILQVSPLNNPLIGGLGNFLNSSGATLGVLIARNMFSDSSDPNHRAALFAAGIALFVVVMVLIAFITKLSKKKIISNTNPFKVNDALNKADFPATSIYYVALVIYWLIFPFKMIRFGIVALLMRFKSAGVYLYIIITKPLDKIFYPQRLASNREYFVATARHKPNRTFDYLRIFLEVASLTIILGSIFWIVIDIFKNGLPNWQRKDWVWSYQEWTPLGLVEKPGVIANTLVFTVVLVLIAILIALPFSLATAIYLSEYSANRKAGKVIRFFLDSLGGTPSILFGMFGVVFFRQVLGLGNGGYSLLAGALTMVIVVIPTFTRSIEQVLIKIPNELRMAAYSLGASKFETIYKVIVPQALPGIVTGIILSAGRVIAETAPVYLTIGMLGSVQLNIDGEGWTMTTKILYNQIFATDNAAAMLKESYAIAAAALLLIAALILVAEIIPWLVKHKPITNHIVRPLKKQLKALLLKGGKKCLMN